MKKKYVTKMLKSVGACWAVRNDKYISPKDPPGSKATYHIHPECKHPHEGNVKRFSTLDDIAELARCRRLET